MGATKKGLLIAAIIVVFLAPPPEVLAGVVEDELESLEEKIQTGAAGPADVQRFGELLQILQDQERKKPKDGLQLQC